MTQQDMDSFIIGGLAGAGATIFTNPMDVVKTRMQLQGELRTRTDSPAKYRGILHALYLIARKDGVLSLQKGLIPAMILGFSMNSVRLGVFHIAEVSGWTRGSSGDISIAKTIFWSSFSGVLSGFTANPASVLKTRIQSAAHPSIAVGKQHSYDGMIDGFIKIYKTEGVRGFFAGVTATCIRLGVGSAAQLTTFSATKNILVSQRICDCSPLVLSFVASALSGVAISFAMCPFDVVSVRLYNQAPDEKLYNGVLDCLRKIFKTEGIHGLYKGLTPLYWRIAPHTTLSLVIWDMLNTIFDKRDKKK